MDLWSKIPSRLVGVVLLSTTLLGSAIAAESLGGTKKADKPTTGSTSQDRLLPPLVWGKNNEWKLQVGGDQRARFEVRKNYDLNNKVGDNDDLGFVRTRVNFDLSYQKLWRVYLEVADARQVGARTELMQEAYWHLHQLYLEARVRENSPWSLRIGRQAVSLGEERLVEYGSWSNLLKLFDGARLRYKDDRMDLSFLVLQPDIYQRRHKPALTTDEPHPLNHTWLYGFYGTFYTLKPHEFDLYALGYSDRNAFRTFPSAIKGENGEYGTSSRYTVGTRWRGPLAKHPGVGTLGYGLEAAYQFGNIAEDDLRAYMLHADINYKWEKPWKPMLKLEGNLASGDRKFGDGENNSFSPLFGTNHTPYGIIDFVRLQNLRELALIFSVEPTDKLKLQAEVHHYWLDSRTDTWYNGPGSLRDKTGQSGRDLGDELSLMAKYKLSKRVELEGGYSHFFAGNFPRKYGRTDGANFFYVQYVVKF
ncbi:MAG: hypothetical protein KatS3mg130_1919 [Candidatus Sumerlaea sp.]|jgi:hypothetical protein|nr:MAG: hypothetical protein KatS3mg130_1919 [Candidatus Sumerlaea sp.]